MGDLLFFSPAVMHAAGTNKSSDIYRLANLLQISSAFGRAMETIDRQAMSLATQPCWRPARPPACLLLNLIMSLRPVQKAMPFRPALTGTRLLAVWPRKHKLSLSKTPATARRQNSCAPRYRPCTAASMANAPAIDPALCPCFHKTACV